MNETDLNKIRLIAGSLFCIFLAPGPTDKIVHMSHMQTLTEMIKRYKPEDITKILTSDEHISVKALCMMFSTLKSKELVEALKGVKAEEKGLLGKLAMNSHRLHPNEAAEFLFE